MIILGIEYKLEEKEIKYFEKNGGNLLLKKLEKRYRKQKGEERLQIYSTQELDKISNFVHESDKIKCNSTVKFYRGTLPPELRTSTKDEVVVQTIGGVPEDKIEDFVDELIFLSERHENLVRVLGCCLVTHEPVIVYELRDSDIIPLSDCTSSDDHAANFSSEKRLQAAKGVARGLKHLYEFNPTFVRGGISSANIMINTTSYEAKIFYAARSNPITSATDLNEKSDLYSFGEVLVELLKEGSAGGTDLSNSMAQADDLFKSLDAKMKSEDLVVKHIAKVAYKCLKAKPTMKEVLDDLDPPTERSSGSSSRSRSLSVR